MNTSEQKVKTNDRELLIREIVERLHSAPPEVLTFILFYLIG